MKKLKSIILFFSVLLLSTSCNDLLDREPKTDTSDAVMWTNPTDFAMAANRFYEYLPRIMDYSGKYDGQSTDVKILDGVADRDRQADILMSSSTSNSISSSTFQVPVEDHLYNVYFSRLRQINYLFKNAESYSNLSEIKQYVAEAHFFRAWASYLFFRDFGPAPIIEKVLDVNDKELYAGRASREEFFDWMVSDLETALELGILSESELSNDQIGRITKGAVEALLARINLQEGTWQKYHYNNTARANQLFESAIKYAENIMNTTEYSLFYDGRMGSESYRWMFILENDEQCNPYNIQKSSNKEYILKNRMHESIRQSNQNITHTYQSNHVLGTRKMVEMYLDEDGLPIEKSQKFQKYGTFSSYLEYRDPRMQACFRYIGGTYWSYGTNGRKNWSGDEEDTSSQFILVENPGGFYNAKWCTERAMSDAYGDGYDVPVIRLGEIYLIYAEALYEKNGAITDNELNNSINKLRDRVGMPHLTNSFVSSNGLDMLTEIRRERAVELYAEGVRLDDLRRWKTAEYEMSQDLVGVPYYTGSAWTTREVFIHNGTPYIYTPLTGVKLTTDGYYIRESSADRKFEEKHYLMPLPSAQLEMYPEGNMEQNPYW